MLFIFMGPSCSGKSSAGEELKKLINVQIYTGKDYLRFSKNENDAWKIFSNKLKTASHNSNLNSESIVYIISGKNDISKIECINDAVTVKFTADSEIIKDRFTQRMRGNLPKPVEKMLEHQLSDWKNVNAMLCVDTSTQKADEAAKKVYEFALKKI